jgi:nitroimidazol reductase NimA-like FMN-containing flavoprotein (pyridoxamine 5'-phosphate oxidase superfamily)
MSEMTKDEIRNFLLQGTFTGKLGTINKNGTPHVVPIWFILDNKNNILFTTGDTSVKAKNIRRDNRVRLLLYLIQRIYSLYELSFAIYLILFQVLNIILYLIH